MQRPYDTIIADIRQAQKKLHAAKNRKDQGNIRCLQARIKLLQKEQEEWKPVVA